MSWGQGQPEEVGSVGGKWAVRGEEEAAVSRGRYCLPGSLTWLPGGTVVSEPPSWCTDDGKGGAWEGCISSGRGLFWRDRYMAGVSRPGSGQRGSEAQGLVEAHAQGSARAACVVSAQAAQRKGLILHSCSAGDLSLTALSGRDDKQFT